MHQLKSGQANKLSKKNWIGTVSRNFKAHWDLEQTSEVGGKQKAVARTVQNICWHLQVCMDKAENSTVYTTDIQHHFSEHNLAA